MKQQPIDGTGRRGPADAEVVLTHVHHDTARAVKLFGFAVAAFLSYFGACMTTFVSTGLDERYIWLAFCLLAAAVSVFFVISALSKPVSEK
jgi:hypothetical protein